MSRTIAPSKVILNSNHFHAFGFGFSWLIVIPAGIWAVAGYYLPLFSENLTQLQTWIVTLLIILMIGVSLVCHILAHLWIVKAAHYKIPTRLTLLIFGDVSQSWPEARFLVAGNRDCRGGASYESSAAGLAYLLWNSQINYFVSLISLPVAGFNVWIFVINLLPAFPMDGGHSSGRVYKD